MHQMIEPIMYLAIGFLVSMLFGLMIVPLVHNRAVRLTTRANYGSGDVRALLAFAAYNPAVGRSKVLKACRYLATCFE